MLPLLTRHKIQVLLDAGHGQEEVAGLSGTSVRSVRRVAEEAAVSHVDDDAEHKSRRIGRPSKAEIFRSQIIEILADVPDLPSLEILRRVRLRGYNGGKSAIYDLCAQVRPKDTHVEMRFEGVAGEFSQHDFGQVDVVFLDGSKRRVHFFASRLKWSRYVCVSIVPDQSAETLIRRLAEHFERFGGVPLCAVFDRPRTVACTWRKDGTVTKWNDTFAFASLEIGFVPELCWPYQPQQKGAVEKLVGWVKGSFFKVRRFLDMADVLEQLEGWHHEVNDERPSRATEVIPALRLVEERQRLRPLRVAARDLALRIPIHVGPTAEVEYKASHYSMPAEAAGISGTLYLYENRVRIIAGTHEAWHDRLHVRHQVSRLPAHRTAHLAAVHGKRGKRYLKRQHLLELGEAAERLLTEIVHARPRDWLGDVERLHDALQQYGPQAVLHAMRCALDVNRPTTAYVMQCLGQAYQPSLFGDNR
ncbi:MAG: IS21 family transposase [Candidatus Solibacter usitatus]|nr:IS21 family transposase [Candidatus Solibacter usitatus]